MSSCALRQPETLTPDPDIDLEHLLTEEKIGPRDAAGKLAVVAMSGGVDSAVTALIMRERGYRVVGMNLRLFSPDDEDHRANPCCGIPAMEDARATCATIGVPFYAINMEVEFGEEVIDRFVNEYAEGRTPNPCLDCTSCSGHGSLAPIRSRPGTTPASCTAIRSRACRTGSSAPLIPARTRATCSTR